MRAILVATVLFTFITTVIFVFSTHPLAPAAVWTSCAEPLALRRSRGGYILVLRYSGQQGAGVQALSSLQQWISNLDLPMKVVEPFIQNSVLGIHPAKKANAKSVRFGEMFDLDNFNDVSRRKGLAEMIPWSVYRASAQGQAAVFVNMVAIDGHTSFSAPTISWQDGGSGRCKVTEITGPDKTSVSLCQGRRAEAYWKFANTHTLSSEEVYNSILGGLDPSNITLIFSLWRGPWQVEKEKNVLHQELEYKDSQNLLNSAIAYQNKFLAAPESRYVAVMIRAEHSILQFLAKRSKNTSKDLEKCMDELVKETDAAMKAVGASGLFVTSDVGYFGSGSWNRTISSPEKGDVADVERRVKRTVERLYAGRQGWTFEEWERSFVEASGGVDERGYVAALQRVVATDRKAACLVLLGGGIFHELSLKQYLYNTNNRTHPCCVRMVCMQRKYRESLTSMLEKAS
ncbi:hypothetical protein GBAR_LOCUS3829 [Geodia barretti]|uniref:Uncharacterized protein n=1 Tax=Geodia barretti TaxID=519541 RepID=A0AA35W7F7_GEOBA|nr:hypothetical protein GBAR_LOCUS3829 [Geodia barretti]